MTKDFSASALRYRPKKFEEVIGQDAVEIESSSSEAIASEVKELFAERRKIVAKKT